MARVVEVRKRLGENYGALGFDARRQLMASLLGISVATGRGPKRAVVTHRVVASLNEPTEAA